MPIIGGVLLDYDPDASGYGFLFGFIAVLCLVVLLASLRILRLGKRSAIRQSSTS